MSMAVPTWSGNMRSTRPRQYFPALAIVELAISVAKFLLMQFLQLLDRCNLFELFALMLMGPEEITAEVDTTSLKTIQERNKVIGTPWKKTQAVNKQVAVEYDTQLRDLRRMQEKVESLLYGVHQEETAAIVKWIIDHGLNEYGDFKYTGYGDGYRSKWGPLYNHQTGQSLTLYDYLMENHPNRPWFKEKREWIRRRLKECDLFEASAIADWVVNKRLNQYGDPMGSTYLPNGPLMNIMTGSTQTLYEYLLDMHPDKPWLKSDLELSNRLQSSMDDYMRNQPPQEFDNRRTSRKPRLPEEPQILGKLDDIDFLLL